MRREDSYQEGRKMCLADVLVFAGCLIILLIMFAVVGMIGFAIGFCVYGFSEETGIPDFLSMPLGIIVGIMAIIIVILEAEMIPSHFLSVLFSVIAGVVFLILFLRSGAK